jgi:hypothetical protein
MLPPDIKQRGRSGGQKSNTAGRKNKSKHKLASGQITVFVKARRKRF